MLSRSFSKASIFGWSGVPAHRWSLGSHVKPDPWANNHDVSSACPRDLHGTHSKLDSQNTMPSKLRGSYLPGDVFEQRGNAELLQKVVRVW